MTDHGRARQTGRYGQVSPDNQVATNMTRLVVANGLVRGDMSICFSMGAVADLAVGQEGLVPPTSVETRKPP
jgi:hypothetical protein